MERTPKERLLAFKVGVFAVIGILVLIYMSIRVGEIPLTETEDRITVFVTFDSVGGLEDKSEVRMAGVVVGRVMRVFLRNGKAVAEASVVRSAQLRTNARVRISSTSMIGGVYLEFIPNTTESADVARDGASFIGEMTPGFTEIAINTTDLMNKLSLIADDIKAVSGSVKNVVGNKDGEERLRAMIEKLSNTLANISETFAQNRSEVDRTVAALREFAETLRDVAPKIISKVEALTTNANSIVSSNREEIREMVKNLRTASERLNLVLDNVQGITADVKAGKGTIGKLVADDTVHEELTKTLTGFRETMASAKEYLGKMGGIKAYLGYRGEALIDESEFKNYLTIRVQPQDDRYFLLEIANDPYGKKRTYTSDKYTETAIEEGGCIRLIRTNEHTEKTKTEEKPLFSLQYARRFGPLTLRGGLIESEGGVAGDLDLLDDKLTFTFEAFDFDDDDYDPHLKFGGRFDVYKAIYLTAGVDEILNEDRRSFYAGVGILFREDDIKYLFGQIPTGGF